MHPRNSLPTIAAAILAACLLLAPSALASGGVSASEEEQANTVPGDKAKLVNGKAIAPESAPRRVQRVIEAANRIRKKPYKYGGGHRRWRDSGYDCSGAVSFALRGGRLLDSPLDSSGLARWGRKGKGKWITVYGASSHAYMVVAGLRFDTSGTGGNGPRWSRKLRSTPERYKARHWRNL